MINQEAKKDLFLSQMKSMRPQQLTNVLRCVICHGLYRFAHTVVDCGHTFCQFCIFTYIKSFKGRNPSVRCPQCNSQIDSNYNKSIMRDVFKQNLVDILEPSYVLDEQKIVKRVKQLFPEIDLQFLLDQFKFCQYDFPTRKKNEQKNVLMGKLVHEIKTKLNVSFQSFVEQICNEQKFNEFSEVIKKKSKKEKLIEIRPKSERQSQYIGIDNKMKIEQGLTVPKLKRFLQKKVLEKIKNFPQQILKEFLNAQKTRIQINISLQCGNVYLTPESSLQQCNEPIYYILH